MSFIPLNLFKIQDHSRSGAGGEEKKKKNQTSFSVCWIISCLIFIYFAFHLFLTFPQTVGNAS